MTRRELGRKVIGALFGVSAIPVAFEKPDIALITTNRPACVTLGYLKQIHAKLTEGCTLPTEYVIKEIPARAVPLDISEATKIYLKERWG